MHKFSKVLSTAIFYIKHTRALTLQNLCFRQRVRHVTAGMQHRTSLAAALLTESELLGITCYISHHLLREKI